MQLPCPGLLDHAAQITARRRHFAGAMLVEGENQRSRRDLRPKTILSQVPGMF